VFYYYRIASVDNNGNVSEPSPIYAARPVDTAAPAPPVWETARWNDDGTAILLAWTLADAAHEILVQRRSPESGNLWFAVSTWLPAGSETYRDFGARTTETNLYRLQVRSASGNLNTVYNEIDVSPFTGDSL
jgi:hypothetical protein